MVHCEKDPPLPPKWCVVKKTLYIKESFFLDRKDGNLIIFISAIENGLSSKPNWSFSLRTDMTCNPSVDGETDEFV
jgi:hypothetical protein